jgi:hypothetical protein
MDDQMAQAWAAINDATERTYNAIQAARRTIDATEITRTAPDGRVAVSVQGNLRLAAVRFARDTFRHYTEDQLGAEVLRLYTLSLTDANAAQVRALNRIAN